MAALSDAWFSVPPAVVLVLADAQVPSWDHAPWYALALVAQLGGDALITMGRARLALGIPAAAIRHELALVYRVDALLAPVGLLAAFGAADAPYAVLLVLPLVALLRAVRPRARGADRPARSSSRRPTAAPRCCSAT